MTLWQAVCLGLIQGLTEFLPISSTAHLRIIPALLGWDDPGVAFTSVIQLGTLVAVLSYFSRDIASITRATIRGLASGKPTGTAEARMGWMIIVGTIPFVIAGFLWHRHVETGLRSLRVIAPAMILLALALMDAELLVTWRQRQGRRQRGLGEAGWLDAIVVGLAQCVALIPGSSRSGCTITGGLFLGLTREAAARFSFLLSLPSILGAGVFEFMKTRHELLATEAHTLDLVLATVVAGVVGYASIAFLLGYLKKHTTWLFIIYRLLLGALLLALLLTGKLSPV